MVCAIIQARMSSTRLPGKVLKEINGRAMISLMVERVQKAKSVNKVILVTSTDPSDDAVEALCRSENILYYRGSLDDVMDRYYQAAVRSRAKTVVRLTGDCPLIDPKMIDNMMEVYKTGKYDYVANTTPPDWTVPEGMDVEIFSFKNLKKLWTETKKPSDREHVTFPFWNNPDLFSVYKYNLDRDLSKYRLTVDYPEDFEVINKVFNDLYSKKSVFSMDDIVDYLEKNPELYKMNQDIESNQGWQSAFDKDKEAGF